MRRSLPTTIRILLYAFLPLTLSHANQGYATCEHYYAQATSHLNKGRFHIARGDQLNQKAAATFQGDEDAFIKKSHVTYKLYDYEMAIYHFEQAISSYQLVKQHVLSLQDSAKCDQALKEQSAPYFLSVKTNLKQAKQSLRYLKCQYAIDKSIESLNQSLSLEKDHHYLKAQRLAEDIRHLAADGASKQSSCSKKQTLFAKDLYEKAWDIIARTNKPLEKQSYCQSQIKQIALKFKNADIEKTSNKANAIEHWQSAHNQIGHLLDSGACSKDSEAWLKTKSAEAEQALR